MVRRMEYQRQTRYNRHIWRNLWSRARAVVLMKQEKSIGDIRRYLEDRYGAVEHSRSMDYALYDIRKRVRSGKDLSRYLFPWRRRVSENGEPEGLITYHQKRQMRSKANYIRVDDSVTNDDLPDGYVVKWCWLSGGITGKCAIRVNSGRKTIDTYEVQ